jgi:polysaccharide biosynthesis/export protein
LATLAIRAVVIAALVAIAGCAPAPMTPPIDPANANGTDYIIGAGDSLDVFVWRNPELTNTVTVRPDGKISVPLVEDVVAVGKTTTQLARDLEERLKKFVREPIVTVMARSFVGAFDQQVRVIGEAQTPRAVPYRENMTVLDVMIQVGGLTKFAAGDDTILVRKINGAQNSYPVRLYSLINDGDVRYNFDVQPGDILIIPQSSF